MMIRAWIHAARLRTLPLSLSGIIAGSFAAYKQGDWNTNIFILAIFTTLFLQILSNFANDLGDSYKGADNEGRIGPQRAIQSGEISQKQMITAIIVMSLLSLATAIPLILIGTRDMPSAVVWTYVVLAVACILAAITYTVGKRAYGYSGFGDLMVFIFFGLVSVLGVYTLYSKRIDPEIFPLAVTIGLLSVAVLNLNNMRDHLNDAAVGKRTMVVSMGFVNAKKYHSSLIILSFLSYLFFIQWNEWYLSLIGLLPFIILLRHLNTVWRTKDPGDLDPELKKVALSTFGISLLFMISSLLCN
ncbi:MAG: 1,4-dihydroxy-2-naphthoate octaprenyltransferase [Brumimicrobium sp.]|nr:1,4-dihydroxy-2-naphthoate octaprenyltransferase [Brumimicrobium sp.]